MNQEKEKITFDWPHFYRSYTIWLVLALLITSAVMALLLPRYSSMVMVFPWPVLGDALLPLLFLGCAIMFRRKWCAVAAVLMGFLVLAARITAYALFKSAMMPFSLSSLRLIWQHTDAVSLAAFLGKYFLWWMIPALLLLTAWLIVSCYWAWKCDFEGHFLRHRFNKVLLGIFLVLALLFNIGYGVTQVIKSGWIYTGSQVKPLLFTGAEMVRIIYREAIGGRSRGQAGYFPNALSAESKAILQDYGFFQTGGPWESLKEKTPRFDTIIIIAVESLDLDFIYALNPAMPENVTPELDQLVMEHPTLTRYYAASQPTSWGLDALLASRLDYQQDVADYQNESLASIAQKLGYQTSYYSPCSGSFANNHEEYKHLFRFQQIVFAEELQQNYDHESTSSWGVPDADLFDSVLADLKKTSGKKLVVVSTMDLHPPYTQSGPESYSPLFSSPFLNALHCTDRNVGNFVREVMADPRIYNSRTLLIVTADHTATHGENYLNRSDFAPERIPLIFITPDDAVFRAIPQDGYASSIDLAPTLLHMLGQDVPDTFMGQDLRIAKNAALSRLPSKLLFLRTSTGDFTVNMDSVAPAAKREKAFYEYYRAFYEE